MSINVQMLAELSIKWVLVAVGVLLIALALLRFQPLDYQLVLTRRRYRGSWEFAVAWLVENIQVVLSVVVVVFLVIRPFFFQAFYIPSESMEETLLNNDRLLVNKLVYRVRAPRRGEIAVFRAPHEADADEQDFIKRVIGLPGETIEIVPDRILVDGKPVANLAGDQALSLSISTPERGEILDANPDDAVIELATGVGDTLTVLAVAELDLYRDGDTVLVNGESYDLNARGYPYPDAVRESTDFTDRGGDLAVQGRIYLVSEREQLIVVQGRELTLDPGHVLVNGKRLEEPYIKAPPHYHDGPHAIEPGYFYMMGDNRNNSKDSHQWGTLDGTRFIGRAELRFWPLRRIAVLKYGADSLIFWVAALMLIFWLRGQLGERDRE